MSFDPSSSAGYLANHMARLFAQQLQARIAPLGLTPGQFPALLALWAKDGQTQRELVQELNIEQATLANTLTRMERDGLIIRQPNPADGRSTIIRLTAKAKALQSPATGAAKEVNAMALAGLSDQEREMFLGAMRQIIQQLKPD
ncbi:MarR family winged helix-turn-helix transcriptional regulator [Actibacterium sp. XHP0104]|uniref:MarR family winged helix-turn-helix transcriptional regulator n=1 Tax=Actibacterium sp. XHP0104 TaxID=2984335 RepID=UPI0021E82A95|nr:MarR family transcriptional regulator [Actibacterium sp. XHP0104]MCV2882185.1 MarR family transcriptional regulator [Actibacterium sp. XHP0104]